MSCLTGFAIIHDPLQAWTFMKHFFIFQWNIFTLKQMCCTSLRLVSSHWDQLAPYTLIFYPSKPFDPWDWPASNFSLQHQGLQINFLTLGRRLNAEDSMPPFRAQCANNWISKRVGSGRNNSNKSSSSSITVSNLTVMWTSKRLVNQAVKRKTQTTRFTYSLVCWKVCSLKWD